MDRVVLTKYWLPTAAAATAVSIGLAVPAALWPASVPQARADDTEDSVVDTCQASVKDQLKDPDSAKFKEWKAWVVTHHDSPPKVHNYHPENGDKLYSAGGMVNAKNGYGRYVGDTAYGCDAAVTTSGDIHARAYNLDDILNGNDS